MGTVSQTDLLRRLAADGIPFVLIGGVAARLYGSARVTQDVDLAVRSLDLDAILRMAIESGFALVTEVGDKAAVLIDDVDAASRWVETTKPGSLSFVASPPGAGACTSRRVAHTDLDIESQIDFLYDLAVPFPRLKSRAVARRLAGIDVPVSSPGDLVALKLARSDRSAADDADIAFLRALAGYKEV